MKQERSFPQMFVTSKAEASIRRGHPWVYHTEITDIQGNCADGALADVLTQKGRYLGTGFFNSHSKIRVRIISTNSNDRFDMAFYERRLRHAWEYRKTVMGEDVSCCRLIFGEADCFPGLGISWSPRPFLWAWNC